MTSRSIAVLPTNNRTGDDLLIGGASFLEQYAWHSDRTAVADILTAEASEHLTQDGFHVIASEEAATVPSDPQSAAHYVASRHLADVALYIEIRRWETEASFHPSFVIAVVDVSLVEATSGRILWTASHPARPILTPGVVSVADAYALAADEVITNLLAPFADGVR
ncbi:MAG: hypothetical protein HY270_06830 [Deltaproteobacteria bacterium]|nr:hypothetical protein [Deltaproteobacteria bacterium]